MTNPSTCLVQIALRETRVAGCFEMVFRTHPQLSADWAKPATLNESAKTYKFSFDSISFTEIFQYTRYYEHLLVYWNPALSPVQPTTMARQWILDDQQGYDLSLRYEDDIPLPSKKALGPNEVLVKLHAASLNYRDVVIAGSPVGQGNPN